MAFKRVFPKSCLAGLFEESITNLGNGRLAVLERHKTIIKDSCQWLPVGIIDLPLSVQFRDYSAVSTYSHKSSIYIAIISQENSQIWIGIVEEIDQRPFFRVTPSEKARVYNLPRAIVNDSMCQKKYCNIEGVAWINEHELILVSDQAKAAHGVICANKDECSLLFNIRCQ